MKRRKLLINENQLLKIKFFILENEVYKSNIKNIIRNLVKNYEPVINPERKGVEFYDELKINKKIDNTIISPGELLTYFMFNYPNYNPEFIKTVITDWYFDRIDDDFNLSSNVSIYKS